MKKRVIIIVKNTFLLENKVFEAGFSLTELLLALFILTIIMTLTTANWSSFWNKQTTSLETRRLYHTLQFAKSEAIKSNCQIGVCGTHDFAQCHPDWSKGYMVFKVNKKGAFSPEQILRREDRQSPFPIHSKQRKVFTFQGNGQCITRGSIYIGETPATKLVIPDSGRVRIEEIK